MEEINKGVWNRDDSRSQENVKIEGSESEIGGRERIDISEIPEAPPLRKIHHGPHGSGRYKMFSNHSSANDIPGTSTGI